MTKVSRRSRLWSAVTAAVLIAAVGDVAACDPRPSSGVEHRPTPGAQGAGTSGAAPAMARFDLVLKARDRLRTADGRELPLAGSGAVVWVARVPDGWLYSRVKEDVRLLRLDGTAISLGTGFVVSVGRLVGTEGESLSISFDGRSIAWTEGATVSTARLAADGLHDRVSTPVPAKTSVITWIGQRVVVGQEYATGCCGYQKLQYDVWDPKRGAFFPHWATGIEPVYGPLPEGRGVGLVEADPSRNVVPVPGCLAELDGAHDMSVVKRTCLSGLSWGSTTGKLSPDGRHLAISRPGDHPIMVIDIATATVARDCPADTPITWEDAHYLLAEADHKADNGSDTVRCTLGSSDTTVFEGGTIWSEEARPVLARYGDV